jgi:hypothetical protein
VRLQWRALEDAKLCNSLRIGIVLELVRKQIFCGEVPADETWPVIG